MKDEKIQLPVSGKCELEVKKEVKMSEELSEDEKIKKGVCPCCESSLIFQEGCKMCISCGWGGCS